MRLWLPLDCLWLPLVAFGCLWLPLVAFDYYFMFDYLFLNDQNQKIKIKIKKLKHFGHI
jgi:hypothetical protein